LLYFSQGLGFLVTEYFHIEYTTGIIQSIAHIADPNVVFSAGILFTIFVLIFNAKNVLHIILTSIVIGVLPNIKIYTAVIVFGALFITALISLVRDKNSVYVKIFFLSGLIGGFVYLPVNYGAGKLIFAPFMLYKHFMESAFVFSKFLWGYKYQYYLFHENYLRLAFLMFIAIFLFFVPSLGIKLISIGYLPKLVQKKFYTRPHIFWLSAISIAFIIPSFFIQNVAVFVIIQFLWFGYILLLLPTSIMLGKLLNKANVPIVSGFFGLLIILNIPDNLGAIKAFTNNPMYISREMVYMANFVKKEIPQDKRIILLNRDKQENCYSRWICQICTLRNLRC
jgi:hypothetical protein